jgi:hypothetical protein
MKTPIMRLHCILASGRLHEQALLFQCHHCCLQLPKGHYDFDFSCQIQSKSMLLPSLKQDLLQDFHLFLLRNISRTECSYLC